MKWTMFILILLLSNSILISYDLQSVELRNNKLYDIKSKEFLTLKDPQGMTRTFQCPNWVVKNKISSRLDNCIGIYLMSKATFKLMRIESSKPIYVSCNVKDSLMTIKVTRGSILKHTHAFSVHKSTQCSIKDGKVVIDWKGQTTGLFWGISVRESYFGLGGALIGVFITLLLL